MPITGSTVRFTDLWAPTQGALSSGVFDPQGANAQGLFNSPLPDTTLLVSGFGNLNPATTPGGSTNPVAAAVGLDQPDPSQGGSTNPGQSVTSAGGVPGSIANYFERGVIIVLGLIFVAAGLYMFGGGMQISLAKGAA